MGARGPGKKPTRLKVLEGNPGRKPLPQDEPQPKAGVLRAPEWLSKGATAVWNAHAPELHRLGVLTCVDFESFGVWCQAAADYGEATRQLQAHGAVTFNGPQEIPSPWHSIRSKAAEQMAKFGSRFGMTPGDRANLDVSKQQEDTGFAAWMKKNNNAAGTGATKKR